VALAAALRQDIPEITNAAKFALWGSILLKYEDKLIDEPVNICREKPV
jgi:hypothetical protein